MKDELTEDLTPASLEALSIVAYLGPISRAKLEYLRGVNSIVILAQLDDPRTRGALSRPGASFRISLSAHVRSYEASGAFREGKNFPNTKNSRNF